MKENKHDMFFGSWYNLENGSGVYAIVNSLNNKKYIGSSGDLRKRFRQHYASLIRNLHDNYHLLNAVNKYGIDKFYFIVLERCENIVDTLLMIELKYIDELGDYNICKQAGKLTGVKTKGHKLSEEQRNNIILANKRRVWTKEMLNKKSVSSKNSKHIQEISKSVIKYTLNGEFVEEYKSMMDAARAIGNAKTTRVGIKRCCYGSLKSAYGYIWKFKCRQYDS